MSNKAERPLVALTIGDVTGIGPEIVARVLLEGLDELCRVLVVGDAQVLRLTLARLGASLYLSTTRDTEEAIRVEASVKVLDLAHTSSELLAIGQPHPRAGMAAVRALSKAVKLALRGHVDGLVYAPLCKEVLRWEERTYNDELDLLREWTNSPRMARVHKVGQVFRTSVTGHVPLRQVPDLVTRERVLDAIKMLQEALQDYGVMNPRLAVAALNPHGGEHGLLGREENEEIGPAVEAARAAGVDVQGPIPADTIYVRAFHGDFDGVVNLYHDQGNIAAKVIYFGEDVVLYMRTPVIIATTGHGTAFDIAGRGLANHANLREAMKLVVEIIRRKS